MDTYWPYDEDYKFIDNYFQNNLSQYMEFMSSGVQEKSWIFPECSKKSVRISEASQLLNEKLNKV